jgi:hypothetical protein
MAARRLRGTTRQDASGRRADGFCGERSSGAVSGCRVSRCAREIGMDARPQCCKAAADWIGYDCEHDRNSSRLARECGGHGCGLRDNRVWSQFDQLLCECADLVCVTSAPAKFDPSVGRVERFRRQLLSAISRTSEHFHVFSPPLRVSVRMFGSGGKKRANASSNCAAL